MLLVGDAAQQCCRLVHERLQHRSNGVGGGLRNGHAADQRLLAKLRVPGLHNAEEVVEQKHHLLSVGALRDLGAGVQGSADPGQKLQPSRLVRGRGRVRLQDSDQQRTASLECLLSARDTQVGDCALEQCEGRLVIEERAFGPRGIEGARQQLVQKLQDREDRGRSRRQYSHALAQTPPDRHLIPGQILLGVQLASGQHGLRIAGRQGKQAEVGRDLFEGAQEQRRHEVLFDAQPGRQTGRLRHRGLQQMWHYAGGFQLHANRRVSQHVQPRSMHDGLQLGTPFERGLVGVHKVPHEHRHGLVDFILAGTHALARLALTCQVADHGDELEHPARGLLPILGHIPGEPLGKGLDDLRPHSRVAQLEPEECVDISLEEGLHRHHRGELLHEQHGGTIQLRRAGKQVRHRGGDEREQFAAQLAQVRLQLLTSLNRES
mmetsp:Transcript_22971/g.66510  ORF Transcript_22971/g.66510 Transcript_22971/m.66510 type:complete len:434 (-) Transcript_22971:556-1857(-)